MGDPVRGQEAVLDPVGVQIPDALVAAVHMAAFLHGEVGLAFQELERGSLQTKQDMLATRIATVDAAYESMWDQLRIARDHLAKLGWNTAAYDEAYAVLGVAGTKMAVLDAVNTYGISPVLSARGVSLRAAGQVGVTVNIMGTNTALGVINQLRALLPEVDWSRPPPPPRLRAPEPDLPVVVDDGTHVESVKPPRRNAVYLIAGAAIAVVAIAVFFAASARNNDHVADAPRDEAAHTAVTFEELRGMTTVQLTDNLVNGRLLSPEVERDARAELQRRYLDELATADLQQVLYRTDAADVLDLDDEVFERAAQRIAALDKPLEDLADTLGRHDARRLVVALGPALASAFAARLAAVTTHDEALALRDLAIELGDSAVIRTAIDARLGELTPPR